MIKQCINKIFLFVLLNTFCISAQGLLKGIISDSLTFEKLKAARVELKGTNLTTVSNIDGEFYFSGIPAGDYILNTSYIGYRAKNILVTVKPGETSLLEVELLPSITIEDKYDFLNQAKSLAEEINLQINSNNIKNVIAGKKMQDMPDENIPAALSRLPGVSIIHKLLPKQYMIGARSASSDSNSIFMTFPQDDFPIIDDPISRVLIRGLDSKFANTTLDGVRFPQNSAIERSIDLNLISERVFRNVELRKTISSEDDADATAGVINFVTSKAPNNRIINGKFSGNYNGFDKSANQYNFSGNYGERFCNNLIGVQAGANLEKKILSSENQNNINFFLAPILTYSNAVKDQKEANIILDFNTPDGGTIKFSNFYNSIKNDYFEFQGDSIFIFRPKYIFTNRIKEQNLILSSLSGNNILYGFTVDWGLAFSESRIEHPFVYSLTFDHFINSQYLDHSIEKSSKNYGIEKTASINFSKNYDINNEITGEIKFGGKYKINKRYYDENLRVEVGSVAGKFQYRKLADGTLVKKDFTATRFDGLVGQTKYDILLSYFQDDPAGEYTLFGKHSIPLINKDALRLWRDLNYSEYYLNDGLDINSYNLSENIYAGYISHKMNFGKSFKFITGIRIENEQNNYSGYYFPDYIGLNSLYNGKPLQTKPHYFNKTSILPNYQVILAPSYFLNLHIAVYKTIIKPDYIERLPKIFFTGSYLNMGNPDLENADVWNYEFQTQFFGNTIGLFSINAFYKEIKGMQQSTNGTFLTGNHDIESLGINSNSFPINLPSNQNRSYNLYTYFNSPKPTRIWGFEIEHQMNFRFLPGILKNLVLSYNCTFLRSENWTINSTQIKTTGIEYVLEDKKQKLGNMPDFFANVILGYDIKGLSFRVSYFYQDGYNENNIFKKMRVEKITRLDIAVRQQVFKEISVFFNLNNITNSKKEVSYLNGYSYGEVAPVAYAYRNGVNLDFGISAEL